MVLYDRPGDDISRGLVGYWKLDDLKRIASDGIIAHYKMNDNAADKIVIDSKGGNNGASANNTDTMDVAGKINNALEFNGTDDLIDLGNNEVLQNFSEITLSLWVNFSGLDYVGNTGNINSFIVKGNVDQSPAHSGFWISYDNRNNDNSFGFTIFGNTGGGFGGGGNDFSDAEYDNTFTNGSWNLITITINSSSQAKLYINGAQKGSTKQFTNLDLSNSILNAFIGTDDAASGFFMDGLIDDVRIYNRALSASEVSTIYNSNSGTETTELFRDTITAIDRANFNDGTITGATNTNGINGLNPDAMFFDGVDDKVVATDLGLSATQPISYSTWFKLNEDGVNLLNSQVILEANFFYLYVRTSVNSLIMRFSDGIEAREIDFILGNGDRDWHHVVGVYDGNKTTKIYVDGILKDSNTFPNDPTINVGAVNIGFKGGISFNGSIQNSRIYNKILTDGQISKLSRLRK